ncbi:unnamed protein product [Caenorhabditis angaria]|uniref:Domain of unknown function DX domain-containing protein n=1 Tax=Caenorhabditis angaria TaxID=860376 RepID=A0A9P1IDZ1_9PELO|nr:unnamed protein product [Caenorhabditis angaria]
MNKEANFLVLFLILNCFIIFCAGGPHCLHSEVILSDWCDDDHYNVEYYDPAKGGYDPINGCCALNSIKCPGSDKHPKKGCAYSGNHLSIILHLPSSDSVCCDLNWYKCPAGEAPTRWPCESERYEYDLLGNGQFTFCCTLAQFKCYGGEPAIRRAPCTYSQYEMKIDGHDLCCDLGNLKCYGGDAPRKSLSCSDSEYEMKIAGHDLCCDLDKLKCNNGKPPTIYPCTENQHVMMLYNDPFCCGFEELICLSGSKPAKFRHTKPCSSSQYKAHFPKYGYFCCDIGGLTCIDGKSPTNLPCSEKQYEKKYNEDSLCCGFDELKCYGGDMPTKEPCSNSQYKTNFPNYGLDALKCIDGKSPTHLPCSQNQYEKKFNEDQFCCGFDELKCYGGDMPTKEPCSNSQYKTNFPNYGDFCCGLDALKCYGGVIPTHEPCTNSQYKSAFSKLGEFCCDFDKLKCDNGKSPTNLPCLEENQYEVKFNEDQFCCDFEDIVCADGKTPLSTSNDHEMYEKKKLVLTGAQVYCERFLECPNGKLAENSKDCLNKIVFSLDYSNLFEKDLVCCEPTKSCQVTGSSFGFKSKIDGEFAMEKAKLKNSENSGYIHQVIKGKQKYLCPIPIGRIWSNIYKPIENQTIPSKYLPNDFKNMNENGKPLKICEKNADCDGFCDDYTTFAEDQTTHKFCYDYPKVPLNISKDYKILIDSQKTSLQFCNSNEQCLKLKSNTKCLKNGENWNFKGKKYQGICIEKLPQNSNEFQILAVIIPIIVLIILIAGITGYFLYAKKFKKNREKPEKSAASPSLSNSKTPTQNTPI